MARIVTQIANVGSVEFRVEAILTLNDWEKVVAALNGEEIPSMEWPLFWLRDKIGEQIRAARTEFEAEKESER